MECFADGNPLQMLRIALVVVVAVQRVTAISWCDYFERIGIQRAECHPRITSVLAVTTYNRLKQIGESLSRP